MTHWIERRNHFRVALRATLYIKHADHFFRSTTRNISIGGFYFLSSQPVLPGERVYCIIVIGGRGPSQDDPNLQLFCTAHVLRVEHSEDEKHPHGVACQIESYEVLDAVAAGGTFLRWAN